MKLLSRSSALALTAVLALTACGGKPSSATPEGAVLACVQALRDNDLKGTLHATCSDAKLAKLRTDWSVEVAKSPSQAEQARLEEALARLTAPDAEQELWAEIEPELAKVKPQVEMMLGMMEGMIASAMDASDQLDDQEKEQGRKVLQALVQTLRKNDITDPARTKKAIAIVCKTARKLGLKTTADVQRLSFDQALERGDVLLAGTKDLLSVYGFSIDDLLDSVKARTLTQAGDKASVEVSYVLLGTPHSQRVEMVRSGDRWIGARAAEQAGPEELQGGLGLPR